MQKVKKQTLKNKNLFLVLIMFASSFFGMAFFEQDAKAANPSCGTITSGVPFNVVGTCDWTIPANANSLSINITGGGGGGGDDDGFDYLNGDSGQSSSIVYMGLTKVSATGGGGGIGDTNDAGANGTASSTIGGTVGFAGNGGGGCIDSENGGGGGSLSGGSLSVAPGNLLTITIGAGGAGLCVDGGSGSVTLTYSSGPIAGVCGTANSTTRTTIPLTASEKCSVGTASVVSGTGHAGNLWSWNCVGIDGGSTATCGSTKQSYALNFAAGANGSLSGTTSQTVYHAESASAVMANPNSGYYFVNWTGTNGFATKTSNPLTVSNVTTGQTITANFTTLGVPGAPTSVTVTMASASSVVVSFTAPALTGNGTITGYTVTSSPAGGVDSNAGSAELLHVMTGLTTGTAYTFTVVATNALGNSVSSAASNSVTPLAGFIITSVIGTGGTMSVTGSLSLIGLNPNGTDDRTLNFAANAGYAISHVYVDGVDQGAVTSYTFTNVAANHTIEAVFDLQTGLANTATFTSKVKKLASNSGFGSMIWNASVPSGTTVKVRVRSTAGVASGTTEANWVLASPTAWSDACNVTIPTPSGNVYTVADISGAGCLQQDTDMYVQYQIILSTNAGSVSVPWVNDVRVNTQLVYSTDAKEIISTKFDTGNDYNSMQDIAWAGANLGAGAGQGTIKFQLRTAATSAGFSDTNWCGPVSCGALGAGGDSNFYTTMGGGNNIHATQEDNVNDRWFQYAAFLTSNVGNNGTTAPILTSVTTNYSFNTPPIVSNLSNVSQSADGKVNVSYTIKETKGFDNLVEQTSAYALLLYKPSANVKLASAIDASVASIDVDTGGAPIPSNGQMMIGTELINFSSKALQSGNVYRLVVADQGRGVSFNGTASYDTLSVNHAQNDEVFFVAKNVTGAAASEIIGITDVASATKTIVWWPAQASTQENTDLVGNDMTGLVLKVVASDNTAFNPVGASNAPTQRVDLQSPTITSITTDLTHTKTGAEVGYYNTNETIPLSVTFSESITSTEQIKVTLNTGYDCVISPIAVATQTPTCSYQVQDSDVTPSDQKLKAELISTTGEIKDVFDNILTNLVPAANLDEATNIIIDNALPTADDLEDKITKEQVTNSTLNAQDTSGSGIKSYLWSQISGAGTITFGSSDAASTTISASGDGEYDLKVVITDNAENFIEKTMHLIWDTTNPAAASTPNVPVFTNDNTPTITWSQATDLNGLAKYEVQRKTGVGGTFATVATITDEPTLTATSPSYTENTLEDATYFYQIVAFDEAGNSSTSSVSEGMTVDTVAATLNSFTSSKNSPPAVSAGEFVDITATFSDAGSGKIKAGSKMRVEIDIAENNVFADLTASADGTTMTGSFEVKATPLRTYDSADLNIRSIVSDSQYTEVEDLAGNKKSAYNLPATNLADSNHIQIDTGGPVLTGLSAAQGAFKEGEKIVVTASFSEALKNTSKARVKINVDGDGEYIDLNTVSGFQLSNSAEIDKYTVKAGDNVQNLQVLSFEEIDGTSAENLIRDLVGETGNPSTIPSVLPETNLNLETKTQIDTIAPEFSITDDVNSTLNNGDTVALSITETNLASVKYIFAVDGADGVVSNEDCATKSFEGALDFPETPSVLFETEDNNDEYLCVQVLDEADNAKYLVSANKFNIDAVNPTAILKVDRSKASGQINLEASDGNRALLGMQMQIIVIEDDASAACNFVDEGWVDYAENTDLPASSEDASFVKVCASLRDSAGNILEGGEKVAVTPETPKDYVLNDLTSETFAGFALTWDNPSQEGTGTFEKYVLNWCKSTDTSSCTPSEEIEILDIAENYSIIKKLNNEELVRDKNYCFSLNFVDKNGDISQTTTTACAVPGSGPVISGSQLSILGNINVASISESTAKVSFTTVDGATGRNNAPLPASTKVYVHQSVDLSDANPLIFEDTMEVNHSINLSGLARNKTYYLRLVVTDSSYAGAEQGKLDIRYSLSVHPELAFTTVGTLTTITIDTVRQPSIITDTKAVVNFSTDQPAKCFIDFKESNVSSYTDINKIIETEEQRNHSITISPLLGERIYNYKITCYDNENRSNSVTRDDLPTFATLAAGSVDESGNGGASSTTKPEISSVSIEALTGESSTIKWNTNKKANSLIAYEVDGATYTLMAGDFVVNASSDKYTTSHAVTVSNLIPGTKYNFNVMSIDTSGNVATSAQSSFTTKQPSGLSSINIISKSLGQATVSWTTGQSTSSLVEYGLTTAYGETKESSAKVKEHELTITDLKPGEEYHLRVKGEDENGELFASSDITFQPKAPPKLSDFKVDSITEHGAIVTFATNVPTDALVTFVNTENAEDSGVQGNPVIDNNHSVKLKDLTSGVTFSVKIKVKDVDGNETEETFTNFTTTKDEQAPKIDRVKTDTALTQNDKVQAIISWTTDEMATGKILYKEGKAGEERTFKVNDQPSFSHVGVITSFKPGVVYYFKVKSADIVENEGTSTDFAVLTPKKRQNIIQIIIGNFTEIFGWAKF